MCFHSRSLFRRSMRGLAVLVLLVGNASAQPVTSPDAAHAFAAAQAEYEVGHYAAAFTAFAALADAGHVESARIALQMQRHGPGLYRMRFAAGPKQVERWSRLQACSTDVAGRNCQLALQAR